MTKYTEFIKQYAVDNDMSYKEATKDAKEAYQQFKSKDSRTLDISLDSEVEPLPLPPKKKSSQQKREQPKEKKNVSKKL